MKVNGISKNKIGMTNKTTPKWPEKAVFPHISPYKPKSSFFSFSETQIESDDSKIILISNWRWDSANLLTSERAKTGKGPQASRPNILRMRSCGLLSTGSLISSTATEVAT